jgi:hypothetical protein
MRKIIISLYFVLSGLAIYAQFNVIEVNKPLKDFPDVYDLSTPLNTGVTILYFRVNGIANLWDDVSIKMYPERNRKTTRSNYVVDETVKKQRLNDTIKELIIYKDSIACMITKIDTAYYSIRWLYFETLMSDKNIKRSY